MSVFDVTLFATAFTTLTVIMDPIGTVPIGSMMTVSVVKAVAKRATSKKLTVLPPGYAPER